MELDKMDENDWRYHGEGNKSLVVSHVQLSKVLRLLKYPAEDSENPPQTAEQAFRQIQNIVDFSSNVMSRLLGDKFIHSGEVVKLPLEFVRQLSIKVQPQRPAWRCDKVMDIYSGCALCLPNLTAPSLLQHSHTPPLCVEIKPKCGFLPSAKHISRDIKSKVCRFCMHQHYKVSSGRWKRRSLYCPLDLFSGSRARMHFAVRQLIEEPQNNFKIFKGGQCIYSSKEGGSGDEDSSDLNSLLYHLRPYFLYANNRIHAHVSGKAVLSDFIQVLVNALLNSGGGGGGGVTTDRREEGRTYCEASVFNKERSRHGSQGLPHDSVLSRILNTQMLDSLNIEGLYPLYRRVEQHLRDFPKERNALQVDGPYNEAFLEHLQKCPAEDDGSLDFAVSKVHQYRVAMTAKDCSIMVALVPGADDEHDEDQDVLCPQRRLRDFLSSRPPTFSYSVSILDLDPKPLDSIPLQLSLDHKIVSCYTRTLAAAVDRDDRTLLFRPV
ncbi:inositol-pentakisphosphate 2-kinase isoform X1 [Hippocampus comes]|uniref:Inositol-pentakisphosphate 2-kinase n=2 Tax=Hippocampus comes TaxID=109280 RepID=A0A3Q2XZ57_HIPCM|nr:PREDICTED: inositol-pentakisphosphate 2-kinase isoform X1 [Hippocampus comes]